MLTNYFKRLYRRTMQEAYAKAHSEIVAALREGGTCLDCGAHSGHKYKFLKQAIDLGKARYNGIE